MCRPSRCGLRCEHGLLRPWGQRLPLVVVEVLEVVVAVLVVAMVVAVVAVVMAAAARRRWQRWRRWRRRPACTPSALPQSKRPPAKRTAQRKHRRLS